MSEDNPYIKGVKSGIGAVLGISLVLLVILFVILYLTYPTFIFDIIKLASMKATVHSINNINIKPNLTSLGTSVQGIVNRSKWVGGRRMNCSIDKKMCLDHLSYEISRLNYNKDWGQNGPFDAIDGGIDCSGKSYLYTYIARKYYNVSSKVVATQNHQMSLVYIGGKLYLVDPTIGGFYEISPLFRDYLV